VNCRELTGNLQGISRENVNSYSVSTVELKQSTKYVKEGRFYSERQGSKRRTRGDEKRKPKPKPCLSHACIVFSSIFR
jgi:hypothetical protein